MYAAVKHYFYQWIFRPRGPESGAIVLSQRRVFILPTTQGITFACVLAVMLVGSINYGLNLGFVLTFLLAAMGLNGMIYTFRNLAGLSISAGRVQPVFAGEKARFTIVIDNPRDAGRRSVGLTKDGSDFSLTDVPPRSSTAAIAQVPAPQRGMLRPGRLTLYTCYPLGFFTAWSYIELDTACVVYPRPAASAPPLPLGEAASGTGTPQRQGHEDFAGLRPYHPGDSPRHIAWKAAARNEGLLTKQFGGRTEGSVWLDWRQLPRGLDVEARLSLLARWVLDAHALGVGYGLRLPGQTVEIGMGEAQRETCLEALALFGRHDEAIQPAAPRSA